MGSFGSFSEAQADVTLTNDDQALKKIGQVIRTSIHCAGGYFVFDKLNVLSERCLLVRLALSFTI